MLTEVTDNTSHRRYSCSTSFHDQLFFLRHSPFSFRSHKTTHKKAASLIQFKSIPVALQALLYTADHDHLLLYHYPNRCLTIFWNQSSKNCHGLTSPTYVIRNVYSVSVCFTISFIFDKKGIYSFVILFPSFSFSF